MQACLTRLFPALLTMNPATGDRNAVIFPVIIGLLVVAAIALVILGVTGKKKKKRK